MHVLRVCDVHAMSYSFVFVKQPAIFVRFHIIIRISPSFAWYEASASLPSPLLQPQQRRLYSVRCGAGNDA